MIKSISYDQSEIIKWILQLHVPTGKIDCDPTYSIGNFYKNTGIEKPLYKFDINPQVEGVEYGDSRELPLRDSSINCPSEQELHQFYIDSLKEAHRVLADKGILIFKCQDKISSGKQYMSHCFVHDEAVKTGFYPKDMFVLLAKNRLVADWQLKNQKNARKFHSYFWVFEKTNKKIIYQ